MASLGSTDRTWIVARINLKVSDCSIPTRRIFSTAVLPGWPRSSFTARSFFQPSVEVSLSMMIWSPVWMPALQAGVSGNGAITVIQPLRTSIWMPSPPYSPLVASVSE